MSKRIQAGCFGATLLIMVLCGACWIWSGYALEAQVRALEPSPYPESTFVGIENSCVFDNAHREIHYFCTRDTAYAVGYYYRDTFDETCACKTLLEISKLLGLISTGRYFGGAVYLRTYPLDDRCDGYTLFSVELVWAK